MALTPTYYGVELAKRVNLTGRNYAHGARVRTKKFTWNSAAGGTAGDTIGLFYLPPQATLFVIPMYFSWTGFTATATIDIGWDAYTKTDGTAAVADDDGLIDGVLLTTASTWAGGMLLTATPDDSNPIVTEKEFDNLTEVLIYASIKVAAPGASATLAGRAFYLTP